MLLQILSCSERQTQIRCRMYHEIHHAIGETLKTEAFELILWLLSPQQALKIRVFALTTLISQPSCKNLISVLLQTSGQAELKFTVFIWDLMHKSELLSGDVKNCQQIIEWMRERGVISPHLIESSENFWKESCNSLLSENTKRGLLWEKQIKIKAYKCMGKHNFLVRSLIQDADTMTRTVVDFQNVVRKSFIEEIKHYCIDNVNVILKWKKLIERLSHEKAVWHFPKSYPAFWQLDPTEGPSRVRKRLMRCHLKLDEKYLLPTERHKLSYEKFSQPLEFLFKEQAKNYQSMVLIERLHCNEKIKNMFSANIITPAIEISGELLIGETCIYFVPDNDHKFQTINVLNTVWPFEDITEIHSRRYELKERGIEIFLQNGNTYFIALKTSKERNTFLDVISTCHLPNKVIGDNLSETMQMWREGLITNWEYLTFLNKIAGRTYNDLMQYPVYPFVLSDYTSSTLDLNQKNIYRALEKPMAVQEKKNELHYVNNYNELLGGVKQATLNKEPYHYGSHYSNSGTVLHFLVRLPPFTKMLLHYQDRNFDLPDRTFHSLHTTWRLASSESTTDVKELIPEFFFLPEFLINSQGFNFGIRQNGEVVNNVFLPPWCKGDPRKFILIHRQALESNYVTENLPRWIDLVFGFKQTGKAAVDAINVFHPATYSGFDLEAITDPVERIAWETMVKTYGQTPKQLFKTPHPMPIRSLQNSDSISHLSLPHLTNAYSYGYNYKEVKGLKWGYFPGSPNESEPVILFRQLLSNTKEIISYLAPLPTNDIIGIPDNTTCLLHLSKNKEGWNFNGCRIALISWGYSDGIIRIKLKNESPMLPLYTISLLDPVTICASELGCNNLWMGHSSGNITVYKFKFASDQDHVKFDDLPIALQGHKKSVTHIAISRAYSLVATTGLDGIIIIWDLNQISYVRSIDLSQGIVNMAVISNTLGDIAAVVESNKNSHTNMLYLFTVNGNFVNSTTVKESISCVCFSSSPEGTSINVIACGLKNGVIRIFSTWDLTKLCDIFIPSMTQPITCVTYSYDSQFLIASFNDGSVVLWQSTNNKSKIKIPKLLNLKL